MLSGGNLPNCIGGGEDYRTVNNNTTSDSLHIRGFFGDNISNACVITNISITGNYCKITNTSGGYATALVSGQVRRTGILSQGSVSGTTFYAQPNTTVGGSESWIDVARNSTTAIRNININFESGEAQYKQANKVYPGVRVEFKSSDHIRMYIKWINITVIRTRACYITFKGDSITEKTTMYDYGTVPSYGSTPSRDGYNFKGWSNGSTTYSGTLPTAYEQDVTYTAVWEKIIIPPEFTSAAITYGGTQVSAQNKVPTGEGYLIAVGIK